MSVCLSVCLSLFVCLFVCWLARLLACLLGWLVSWLVGRSVGSLFALASVSTYCLLFMYTHVQFFLQRLRLNAYKADIVRACRLWGSGSYWQVFRFEIVGFNISRSEESVTTPSHSPYILTVQCDPPSLLQKPFLILPALFHTLTKRRT